MTFVLYTHLERVHGTMHTIAFHTQSEHKIAFHTQSDFMPRWNGLLVALVEVFTS